MDSQTIVFEFVIALVVVVIPLFFLEIAWRWKRIPYRGRYVFAMILLFLVWGGVFYGSFITPRKLDVVRKDIFLGEKGGRLKVALISDMHFGYFRHADWAAKIVDVVNAEHPDVVILAGDFVSDVSGMASFSSFRNLKSTHGTYAVLGNNDYRVGAVDVRHAIESFGVEVLTNESIVFTQGEKAVRLVGIDDLWYGTPDWNAAFSQARSDETIILASHNPDAAPVGEFYGADLVLSGHTHGGQIRLPVIGALAPLPITIDQSFDEGLFSFGPTSLYITSGAGESGTRARFFNPPEIVILNLRF